MENMRATASVKQFDFQNLTLKADFDQYCGRTVFRLSEKLVVNNICRFLEY